MEKHENMYDIFNKKSNWINIDETTSTPSPVISF